jgi:hypothetical protein
VIRIAALGVALSLGLLAVAPANGDVGVAGLAPRAGAPGEWVEVSIGCGWCASSSIGGRRRPPAAFPVSVVPLARTPKPQPCRASIIARLRKKLSKAVAEKAECSPEAAEPPRRRPYVFLGKAKPLFDLDHPPYSPRAANYRLRFRIPRVTPGPYAFVIYLGFSGGRGGLDVDPFRYLLHVRQSGSAAPGTTGTGTGRARSATPGTTGTGTDKGWWIAGGAALFLLAGGAVLLRRRLAT